MNVLNSYEGVDVPICEVCGKPKAYLHNGKLYPSMCDCQIKEHEAAEAAERVNASKLHGLRGLKQPFSSRKWQRKHLRQRTGCTV